MTDSTTLVESLRTVAADVGDRRGLTYYPTHDSSSYLGYAGLDERARTIAESLMRSGYRPGQTALIGLRPGTAWLEAAYGALYAGLTFVPLPIPGHGPTAGLAETVASIALASEAAVMIAEPTVLDEIGADGLTESLCDIALLRDLTDEGDSAAWTAPDIDGDSVALLLFTSGSTGVPKGVMATHSSIVTEAAIAGGTLGFSARTVFVGWLPLYHSMGLTLQWFTPALYGAQIVLTPTEQFQRRPTLWLQLLHRHRATATAAGNFAFALATKFAGDELVAGLDLSSIEVMVSAGEPVRSEIVHEFANRFRDAGVRPDTVTPAIGMTETMLYSAKPPRAALRSPRFDMAALEATRLVPAEGEGSMELTSCGRPFPTVSVRIADPTTGDAVPDGQIGEIWVSSPAMSTGYFRRPDATAEAFGHQLPGDDRSYLRTGDLAAMIDGELFVTGRLKDLIIIRGRNIYPQDIEAATRVVWPQIGLSTAFELTGHPSAAGLLVEVDRDALADEGRDVDGLVRELGDHLKSRFSLPSLAIGVVDVGALPRTATGKVQRRPTHDKLQAGGFDLTHAVGFAPARARSRG